MNAPMFQRPPEAHGSVRLPTLWELRAYYMPEGRAYVAERQAAGEYISNPEHSAYLWAGCLEQDAILRPERHPEAIAAVSRITRDGLNEHEGDMRQSRSAR